MSVALLSTEAPMVESHAHAFRALWSLWRVRLMHCLVVSCRRAVRLPFQYYSQLFYTHTSRAVTPLVARHVPPYRGRIANPRSMPPSPTFVTFLLPANIINVDDDVVLLASIFL